MKATEPTTDGLDEEGGQETPSYAASDPATRLLDMIAGWSQFVQRDLTDVEQDAGGEVRRVCDLYGRTGEFAFSDALARASGGETEAALRGFLVEHVLPVLLGRDAAGTASFAPDNNFGTMPMAVAPGLRAG